MENLFSPYLDILNVAPQLVLILFIVTLIIGDLVFKNKIVLAWFAAAGLLISLLMLILTPISMRSLFSYQIIGDKFGYLFQILFLTVGIIIVFFSFHSKELGKDLGGEYFALLLTAILGMFYMATATNLLMLYLSMETVSLSSYLLTGYTRGNRYSSEAAFKYLIFGATSSGIMIMGMAYLYGLTGSLNFSVIHSQLVTGIFSSFTLYSIILMIFAGFFYKMSLVPFHMWAPDVYEGAPTPVAAFLAVGSKAAGFAMALRFLYSVLATSSFSNGIISFIPVNNLNWPLFLGIIAVLTMTIGNITALNQTSLKRLLAYSSIAHAGYMLMGFAAMNKLGFDSVIFYLFIYMIMNVGAFLVVQIVYNKIGTDAIVKYRGISRGMPFASIMLAIFLFSLAGIPPFGGFIGKFYLFAAVLKVKMYWLAVIGIINSVVSLYYYARIPKMMFLEDSRDIIKIPTRATHVILLILLAVPIVVLGVYWSPLFDFVKHSAFLLLP